ncbi:type II secretion system protein [Shewanella nanhaiensis]|uniref:Type II secretion system GspH family protein n=1 Tax=Shewanella nanhaiensis TaxID=2864872 RepID=A0ABS7DZN6_9GAMM|nr:type II secretion system protein [Shewanella nanhaiensis]MBW8182822.1 type II secretion system GspH family protein [Shewanella nanhaiensis]
MALTGEKLIRRETGFTLVELVTTIILIAILSVVVLPRMLTNSSYSAFTLRDEFISELRKAQLLAMNNQGRCYRVAVDSQGYQLQRFGDLTCTTTTSPTESKRHFEGGARLSLISSASNSFNIDFSGNSHGVTNLACSGACINVVADATLTINVESQGYIHGR